MSVECLLSIPPLARDWYRSPTPPRRTLARGSVRTAAPPPRDTQMLPATSSTRDLNRRFLKSVASCIVASNVRQAHCPPVYRHAL